MLLKQRYVGAAATVGGGGVQYCPSRVSTAHAAGGVIRDCLTAAHRCRYPACRRRVAAARHCRYAVCHSHLAATTAAVVVEPPAAVCALAQRSRAAAARTDWYAARRCRYPACRRHLAAAVRLCRYAVSSRRLSAAHRCRYAVSAVVFRSIATVGDTAYRMFADAGVVFLFHRGRRLDDVAITITGGDTGPADVQELSLIHI